MNTRYFVLQDRDGTVGALFKSEWEYGRVVSEASWDYAKGSWETSKAINKWNHFGDTEIEELTEQEFTVLFSSVNTI